MRVLITGASGFIGRAVLAHAPSEWRITTVSHLRPPLISDDMGDSIPDLYDIGIHLAGNGDPARSALDPLADLASHAGYLIKTLERFTFRRFVYVSSGAVYDGNVGAVHPGVVLNPTLPYAVSKMAAEQYVKHFAASGEIGEYAIIRFFGAYGPGEPERKVFTRLVRQFGILRDPIFEIKGDGENLIDAMFIDDAAQALIDIASSFGSSGVRDLAAGVPWSINSLVKEAGLVFGIDPQPRHVGTVPEYNRFWSDDAPTNPVGRVCLADGLRRLRLHLEGK